jgi:hypothetical protein
MKPLIASIAGPSILKTLFAVSKLPAFADELPAEVADGHDLFPNDKQWPQHLAQTKHSSLAFWKHRDKQISYRPKSDKLTFGIPDAFSTVEEALSVVEPLDFEICVFGSVFFDEWIKADYERWGIGRSHVDHGWGVLFRGKGHERLVSRRWLDFGPWRVLRRPNDSTFIQFHDLEIADPVEAYEQAKSGHERMGNSPIGGYLAWHMEGLLKNAGQGLYDPDTRSLHVVIAPGIEVTQAEMLRNAALRLHHRLTRPGLNPIDQVAYVFIDMADARAHLHELWLRELECWAFNEQGQKVRLDLDYHPTPDPPAWVKRLDGR